MKHIAVIVLFLIILLSCNRSKNAPHPEESNKWDIDVKCKIDGKHWQSCSAGSFPGAYLDEYPNHYFIFNTANWCSADTFFNISFRVKSSSFDTGSFELNQFDKASITMFDGNDWLFQTNHIDKGLLHITAFDKINQTIDGWFECKANDSTNKRKLIITEGILSKVRYSKY